MYALLSFGMLLFANLFPSVFFRNLIKGNGGVIKLTIVLTVITILFLPATYVATWLVVITVLFGSARKCLTDSEDKDLLAEKEFDEKVGAIDLNDFEVPHKTSWEALLGERIMPSGNVGHFLKELRGPTGILSGNLFSTQGQGISHAESQMKDAGYLPTTVQQLICWAKANPTCLEKGYIVVASDHKPLRTGMREMFAEYPAITHQDGGVLLANLVTNISDFSQVRFLGVRLVP